MTFPPITTLPKTMPEDGSISMKLEDGVPVFRASQAVIDKILELVAKSKEGRLTTVEQQDLDQFEVLDDYLSYLNRLVRNQHQNPKM